MKTNRLSSLLFIVTLLTVMLAGTQQSVTSSSAIAASCYASGAPLGKYTSVLTLPIPVARNVFIGSQPVEKSSAFLADSNTTPTNWPKANDPLASLTRRSMSAFTNDQANELFINVAGAAVEEDALKMYYALSALSLSKRRAAFRNSSASVKSDLWRTHLAIFFVKQELTEWQKEVIWSATSLATPEYFRIKSGDPDWEAKVQQPTYWLEQHILDAFAMDDAARIFATLGDDKKSAKTSSPVLVKGINYKPLNNSGPYKQIIPSRFAAQDFELESTFCECATNSDYCSIWRACRGGGCAWTVDGCGTFWSYPCNGVCR